MKVYLATILFFFGCRMAFGVEPVNLIIEDKSYIEKYKCAVSEDVSDEIRIPTHLNYVKEHLCNTNTDHLPLDVNKRRAKLLILLEQYIQEGNFPKNFEYPNQRKSVFIDKDNHICAVGYLMQQTVGQEIVELINEKYKHHSILEMNAEILKDWAKTYGLSLKECAMIQPTYGGGWIIPDPPIVRPSPRPRAGLFELVVNENKVEVEITENSATTKMSQVFYNSTNNQLQGYYIFPIPKGASIDYFSMLINGKETQGEILDADKARKIYQDIVNRYNDPALLEYYKQGLFRVKIFPIPPKQECHVKLTYTTDLPTNNNTVAYTFPLKSPELQSKQIKNISFKIKIKTNEKLKNIYCPTHEVELIRHGEKEATIGFEGNNVSTENDLKVYFSTDKAKIGLSALTYKPKNENGYFMLNISPGLDKFQEIINKDITFVLDASGSMAGEKMEQAKSALAFCVNNLNENDCFNVVRFSTEASSLFEVPEPANKENVKQARAYIDGLKAIGGTNIDEALEMALGHKKKEGRPHFVVFLTDGKPTIGETRELQLLQKIKDNNAGNTKIFTFGIGSELNTHLLDKLTEMTKAYRTYVLPQEDIEIKVSDFYTKVSSPILTDVKINFDRNVRISEMYPKEVPDVFKGETINLFGRYNGTGSSNVTIEGKVNGKLEKFHYTIDLGKNEAEYQFIPKLWASRAVGYLLDQIRLHGESKELVEEVVRISKQHGIITPYTSYLIIEDERISLNQRRIQEEDQLLRPRFQSAPMEDKAQMSYESAKRKEGEASVRASTEIQSLNKADNLAEVTVSSKSELNYKDANGVEKNVASDIRNLNGRAFYFNNNTWTDANVQTAKSMKVNRLKFNSKDYLKLLDDKPESADYLALGRNVRFVLDNQVYEIYE